MGVIREQRSNCSGKNDPAYPRARRKLATTSSKAGVALLYSAMVLLLLCFTTVVKAEEKDFESTVVDVEDASPIQDYAPQFQPFGRDIIGRADVQPTGLSNNAKVNLDVRPSGLAYYSFSVPKPTNAPLRRDEDISSDDDVQLHSEDDDDDGNDSEIVARQAGQKVFLSINACTQPGYSSEALRDDPPQLTLWYSTSAKNPGPNEPSSKQTPLVEGFAQVNVTTNEDTLFVSVEAPAIKLDDKSAVWNFDLAASTDEPYHRVANESTLSLALIDSDPSAALLVTVGLTEWAEIVAPGKDVDEFLAGGPPFGAFVWNSNNTATPGLRSSYCALGKTANMALYNSTPPANGAELGITRNLPGGQPEEQLYVPGLNRTSMYRGRLSQMPESHSYGDAVAGGGGVLYPTMNFTTKRDANCAVIYNLTFCSQVAYAVPANPFNPEVSDISTLAQLYDQSAQQYWDNFTFSLGMTACNTTPTAQYSLVAGCDNCTAAYKTWLCAVQIPRCADFEPPGSAADTGTPGATIDATYLMPRNVAQQPLPNSLYGPVTNTTQLDWVATNSSRNNATIAGTIRPGPYMEVLPCEDLCFDLVRMCPATLQFACPRPGSFLLSASYGKRGHAKGGSGTCSAPGVLYFEGAAASLGLSASTLAHAVFMFVAVVGWTAWG